MSIIHRLSDEVYDNLVSNFPNILVTKETTDIQAGYMLGVQAVLAKLREGFVIGNTNKGPSLPLQPNQRQVRIPR